MVGRELVGRLPEAGGRRAATSCSRCASLSSRAAGVRDVSLSVRRGEILGHRRAGRLGPDRAGRNDLRPDAGRRRRDPAARRAGRDRIAGATRSRAGIAYVPEDRRRHGVVARDAGRREHEPGQPASACRGAGLIDRRAERDAGAALRRAASHQDRVGRRRGRHAVRRQSAEGRAGALAGDRAVAC